MKTYTAKYFDMSGQYIAQDFDLTIEEAFNSLCYWLSNNPEGCTAKIVNCERKFIQFHRELDLIIDSRGDIAANIEITMVKG